MGTDHFALGPLMHRRALFILNGLETRNSSSVPKVTARVQGCSIWLEAGVQIRGESARQWTRTAGCHMPDLRPFVFRNNNGKIWDLNSEVLGRAQVAPLVTGGGTA
jgi:hypothetical protein